MGKTEKNESWCVPPKCSEFRFPGLALWKTFISLWKIRFELWKSCGKFGEIVGKKLVNDKNCKKPKS